MLITYSSGALAGDPEKRMMTVSSRRHVQRAGVFMLLALVIFLAVPFPASAHSGDQSYGRPLARD